ncbi:MAG: hypothetical protein IPJ32_18335 [Sphingobacteriaceae bacterium]|nr:hypothetical protein [Sphingobacteriaceae bacterium]
MAAIYLRNDKFKNIPQLTEENIRISSQENIYDVISIPKPSRYVGVLKSFFTKQYIPIEEQNKATFCFTYGFNKAALQYSAQGIRRATINPNNIFYNLNMHFFQEKGNIMKLQFA